MRDLQTLDVSSHLIAFLSVRRIHQSDCARNHQILLLLIINHKDVIIMPSQCQVEVKAQLIVDLQCIRSG